MSKFKNGSIFQVSPLFLPTKDGQLSSISFFLLISHKKKGLSLLGFPLSFYSPESGEMADGMRKHGDTFFFFLLRI